MTVAADRDAIPAPSTQPFADGRPVEFWPTALIRDALETGDITVWQRIVVAIKRDPYGRTARQVEEVLEHSRPYGISKALSEVLIRARNHLEANERAEAARHVRLLLDRSGLTVQEFSSRIGVAQADLSTYLDATVSPPASLMIRMRRLSDRFAKMRAQRASGGE
ncbi:XRE family transcriptional regulator [Mycolicibacterium sphagni]|uniref:XRE family transcriptional regulator n=1 Tax=Mycolicibacterium sphagni TaxID=1786 RepID=A0ABX2JUK3_9MYCO|nr:XRE family transcriptional regulator [Mycolicibacterium sphagni]